VIQDVITSPTEKSARIQCRDGYAEWLVNYVPNADAVRVVLGTGAVEPVLIPKSRPTTSRSKWHISRIFSPKE